MDVAADPRVGALPTDPMEPVPYRVVERGQETDDVASLVLAPVAAALPAPGPGQFMMIWAPGVGEIPISVSRVVAEGHLVLTVRSVGAVSAAVVGLGPGDVVGLRGPFGTQWPVADVAGRRVLVVAGGLGLAPLRIAVEQLVAAAPAHLTLVMGARQPDQLLFPDDLRRWAAAGVGVHVTVDAADRGWHGAVGTATAMVTRIGWAHDAAFVCGPEIMMTTAARATVALGTPADSVWVSLERNMHCGIARCGRCQLGPYLLCRDGAVVPWTESMALLEVRGR
ncbi:MAG: FAD/NAD(P)-binding protein [Acidimicrobiaceae bacterium]|nr:FAD/NAD(P)-binding protein [Acidimicrobiaceae bacterium]